MRCTSGDEVVVDSNCDGLVNNFDVDPFAIAIQNPSAAEPPVGYGGDAECWERRLEWGDIDGNGLLNNFDIDPFVDVLFGGSAIARIFTWNAENKLVMAAPAKTPPLFGSQRVSFVYDYMGRRIEKLVETWTDDDPDEWVQTSRTRFVYDGWLLLEELETDTEGDIVGVLRQYTWGLDLAGLTGSVNDRTSAGGIGGLLAVHDETVESGEDYIYLYDANGNVCQLIALEDGYGGATADEWHADRLVARYEYDAYGRIVGPDTDDDGDWRDDAGPRDRRPRAGRISVGRKCRDSRGSSRLEHLFERGAQIIPQLAPVNEASGMGGSATAASGLASA